MSERATDDYLLYLISSDVVKSRKIKNFKLSRAEKNMLREYNFLYDRRISLDHKIWSMRNTLSDNGIEIEKLNSERDKLSSEIDMYVARPLMQNVLTRKYKRQEIAKPKRVKSALACVRFNKIKIKISLEAMCFIIPLFIQAVLFFIAICDLPYAYYNVLRVVTFFQLGLLCVACFSDPENYIYIGAILAVIVLIFNPIDPFYMPKDTWVIVDTICGFVMLGLCLYFFIMDIIRSRKQ